MFQSLGWFFGLNYRGWSTKRLPDAKPRPARVKPVAMLDTVQEISIYIHRFHNLDLFQQGYGIHHFMQTHFVYLFDFLSTPLKWIPLLLIGFLFVQMVSN